MINLYAVGNTTFTNNGDATLLPISCTVKIAINGAWQLNMELPYDKEGRYKLVSEGAVVKIPMPAVSEQSTPNQLFRIYDYKRNLHSVSVIAFPVAMESTFDAPISQIIIDTDITGAVAASNLNGVSQKYTISSDISNTGRTVWTNTNLNKAICGADENSFINVWGGEVCYDNYAIKIKEQLGDSTNEDKNVVMYGKNITAIAYEIDDSGLITRVYPLSTDGIRYNDDGTEYIDSDKISDYPIIHANYMTTPYKLVEDDAASISRTAVKTADIKSRIRDLASTLSHSIWNTAVSNGWKIEYMVSIYKDIIANIQAMVTANYAHDEFIKAVNDAVASGMAWMAEQEDPEWTWIKIGDDAYKYGNTTSGRYAQNEWQYADKKWRYFGNDYLWQEPADDDHEWAWYEDPDHNYDKKYGTRERYYLAGQYIYYTENGDFKKFWLDGDGWYDADKTDVSDYAWHQDSEVGGAWYFGTEDEDGYRDKYVSGQWVFIEGSLYWFDDNGYYYGEKKDQPPLDWHQSGEAWWFGDLDRAFDEIFVTSQWLKIDRQWYRFNSSGYLDDIHTEALSLFHNGMSSLTSLVATCNGECYELLYDLMEEWTEKQFSDGIDTPTVTINVDMVDLSRTIEYKDYQNLEKIHLGDTVKCVDYVHAIATVERVVELTYDVLRGYNTAITIGVANSTVGSMLSGSTSSGSGSGYNSAINVQVIEQNIAEKNPILRAGKNITLTDNLDGTQTIASDKLIRAGENVSVQHNADGSDTISASGGALTWWHENQSNLYSDNVWEGDTWHAIDNYYFDYQVRWEGHIYSDRYYGKETSTPALIGAASINGWGVPIIVSDKPDGVEVWGSYGGSHQQYQASFDYKGITWYIGATNGYFQDGGSSPSPTEQNMYGFYGFTPNTSQYYHAAYPDFITAAKALIDFSELTFEVTTYHGFARGGNLAFFAGGDNSTGANAPIKIYSNGTYEGLDKVEDITDGEGNSIVVDKVADISHKQNTLIEGDNITLTEQQDGTVEISATDTNAIADMTDVDIDEQTLLNGQVLKWNATSEKWENRTGGGSSSVIELTQEEYDELPDSKLSDDNVYMVYFDGGRTLDPNYNYYKYGDNDEIVVRVYHEGESDQQTLWFFKGFTKTASDWSVPSSLQAYTPSSGSHASAGYNSAESTTQIGWIGWAVDALGRNTIRSWSNNWTTTIAGTFYAVIDVNGQNATLTQYYDPYVYIENGEATRRIYLNGRIYTQEPPFKVINGQLCIKYKKEVTS